MRKTSDKPTLAMAAKVVVFLLCAYASATHMTDYWVIGPMFGLVVLIWRSPDVDDLFKPEAGLFLIASTLIYVLVVKMERSDKVDLQTMVGVGTILLPLAHAYFLKAPWRRTMIAIPAIYITWFVLSRVLGYLNDSTGISQTISEAIRDSRVLNLASVWQAAYLGFMFWPELRAGWRPKR